jgi:soluble lytic murein transglycosylase-like protein
MALRELYSINPSHGEQSLIRLNHSPGFLPNRTRVDGFKRILSSHQAQSAKIPFKTKGLTIADYRARPVISKSRPAPFSRQDMKRLTPPGIQHFLVQGTSANTRTDKVSAYSPAGRNREKASKGIPPRKTNPYQPVLTDQQIIAQNVQKAAAKYDLPPELINGVIRAESNFMSRAVSPAGAQGLMQLMPATAKELGVQNPFDIGQNINGGAKYLKQMLDRFGGNVRKALAAYNAGPGTVMKYDGRVPYPETRQYVNRVLRFSRQMV